MVNEGMYYANASTKPYFYEYFYPILLGGRVERFYNKQVYKCKEVCNVNDDHLI